MGEVIQFQYVKLLEMRDLNEVTMDGKRTQRDLFKKIRQIVHGVNYTDAPDRDIYEFLLRSFSIHGIMDTYNELGYCGWKQMITQMAEHEVFERRDEHGIRTR
jgi:hypothetical protein